MTVRQNPRVASRVYEGRAEVITLDDPIRQHRLNEVGTRIWELAEGGVAIDRLADLLAREYEVDDGTAAADALAFCAELVHRGILLAEPPAAGASAVPVRSGTPA